MKFDASATQKLEEVSLARQQMIAIARAVDMKCKVLILDEPTSSLDDDEVAKLFKLMNRLKDEGVGIIFVTHFLEQVYEVCDRIHSFTKWGTGWRIRSQRSAKSYACC